MRKGGLAMSKYAVYRLFNGCEAPGNISTFGGYLAGALVGTSDKNPLSRQHDGVHEHVTGGKAIRELGYEPVEDDGDA